jgi:hypothetical protein
MPPTTWGSRNSPRYLYLIFMAPTASRCPIHWHVLFVQEKTLPRGLLLRLCPQTGQVREVSRSS